MNKIWNNGKKMKLKKYKNKKVKYQGKTYIVKEVFWIESDKEFVYWIEDSKKNLVKTFENHIKLI